MHKKRKKKKYYRLIIITIVLSIIVLITTYMIFYTDYLNPKINKTTTSYISFNNKNTTDMLKITNIKVMSDRVGSSKNNPNSLKIKVDGEKNLEYEIILYPLTNNIPLEKIYYSVSSSRFIKKESLSKTDESTDGGRIIHYGRINNKDIIIRLWIGTSYKKEVSENSFEIKVKPR